MALRNDKGPLANRRLCPKLDSRESPVLEPVRRPEEMEGKGEREGGREGGKEGGRDGVSKGKTTTITCLVFWVWPRWSLCHVEI